MITIPKNYLELNWLGKKYKDLSLPIIVYMNSFSEYSGAYYNPQQNEIVIDDKYYPLDKGLICIDVNLNNDKDLVNTIAHEFRHHWQYFNGISNDCIGWNPDSKLSYQEQIIKYFKSSYSEMDAFLFAEEISSSDVTEEWKEWLIQDKIKNINKGETK